MRARQTMRWVLAAAALFAALPASANTETTAAQAAVLGRADALLAQQAWQPACDLLETHFGRSPANLQALARLGECRSGLGQYGRAIADYRRILETVEAPIILTRVLVLEAAIAGGVVQVADAPTGMQAGLFSGEATLGILLDSNANAGTSATSVQAMIGGFPLLLTLNPANQQAPDTALTFGLSGRYLQPLNANWALTFSGGASADMYMVDAANSRQSLQGTAGIVFRDGPVTANLQGDLGINLEGGVIDQTRAGIGARANLALGSGLSVGLGGYLGYRDVAANTVRDSVSRSVTAGLQYELTPELSASLDYVVTRSEAGSPLHSYWSHGPRVGVVAALGPDLGLNLSYSYEMADYDASVFLFPQGRHDRTHALGATLKLDLSDMVTPGLSASLGYSYRHTDSSIDMHDTERHAVSASVSYAF